MADPTGVSGAVYVPARAYNAYQQWNEYDPTVAKRDLDLAATLNRDGLRVFLSYEHWLSAPDEHERTVGEFLDAAVGRDVDVVPVCFESAGRPPTTGNLTDRDPLTAAAVRSPAHTVLRNGRLPRSLRGPEGVVRTLRSVLFDESRWDRPARYVRWFVDRFGDHPAVLALELMNEPGGWSRRERFAQAMLRVAAGRAHDLPLTMGCKAVANNRRYRDPGLDVWQFHCNLPPTPDEMRARLDEARDVADDAGRPVWLTEWQRTRETPPDVLLPNYESLADVVAESAVDGDFFWSLMLKPAYLPVQRRRGRLNGVFHEDGAVYSTADARAVAGDPDLAVSERQSWPSWARSLATAVDAPRPADGSEGDVPRSPDGAPRD